MNTNPKIIDIINIIKFNNKVSIYISIAEPTITLPTRIKLNVTQNIKI